MAQCPEPKDGPRHEDTHAKTKIKKKKARGHSCKRQDMCMVVTNKEKRRVRFGKEYIQGGDIKGKDLLKIDERHERNPCLKRLRDLDKEREK